MLNLAVNSDKPALAKSTATHKILIGEKATKGMGAGARPEVGTAQLKRAGKLLPIFSQVLKWYSSLPVWAAEQVQVQPLL